jgi:hypothetical protein
MPFSLCFWQAKQLLHSKLAAVQHTLQQRETWLQEQVAAAQLQLELLTEAKEQQQQQQQSRPLGLHAVGSATEVNSLERASSYGQRSQYSSSDQNSIALDGISVEETLVPMLAPELESADPWAAFREAAEVAHVGDGGPTELELPLWMLPRSMAVKVHEATIGPGMSSSTSGRGRRLSESDSYSCSENESVNGLPEDDGPGGSSMTDAAAGAPQQPPPPAAAAGTMLQDLRELSVPLSLAGGGPVPPSVSTLSLVSHAQTTLDELQQRLQGREQQREDQPMAPCSEHNNPGGSVYGDVDPEDEEVAIRDTSIMDDELLKAFKDLKLHHDSAHQQPHQCGELETGIDDVVARMKTCYCKMVRELQREMNQLQLCVEELQQMEAEQAVEAAAAVAAAAAAQGTSNPTRAGKRVSFAANIASSSKQEQLEQQQKLLSRHFRRLSYLYRAAISMPRSAARAGPCYFWRFFAPLNHPAQRTCPRMLWHPAKMASRASVSTGCALGGGGASGDVEGQAPGNAGVGAEAEAAAPPDAAAGVEEQRRETGGAAAAAAGHEGLHPQQQQEDGECGEDVLQRLLAEMGPPKEDEGSQAGSEDGRVAMEWHYDFEPMVPEVQCSMWEGDPLQEYDELLKEMQDSIAHGNWHLLQQPRPMEGVIEQQQQLQQLAAEGAGVGPSTSPAAAADRVGEQDGGGVAPVAAASSSQGVAGEGLCSTIRVDWEAGFFKDGVVPDQPPEELYEVALQLLCMTPKQSEVLLQVSNGAITLILSGPGSCQDLGGGDPYHSPHLALSEAVPK